MTTTLRKIHRYTWLVLAVLLPIGWLAAIRVLPEGVWQTPVRPNQPTALPRLIQTKQSGDFVFNLREDSTGTHGQLEIFIKKPQTNPNTALIIESADPVGSKRETVLGLLGSRGVWRFPLDSLNLRPAVFSLRMEDNIEHRTLRTIQFEH